MVNANNVVNWFIQRGFRPYKSFPFLKGPRGDQNPPKEKDAGSVLDPLPRSVLVPVPDQKARPEALAPAPRERSAAPPELREKPKPPERGKTSK